LEKARGFFLFSFHHFYEIAEIIFFKNFPSAFFNILKEPLLLKVGVALSGGRHARSPGKGYVRAGFFCLL